MPVAYKVTDAAVMGDITRVTAEFTSTDVDPRQDAVLTWDIGSTDAAVLKSAIAASALAWADSLAPAESESVLADVTNKTQIVRRGLGG